jgi:hypothetical protein
MGKSIQLQRNGLLRDADHLPSTAQPPNRKRPRPPKRLLFAVCAVGGLTAGLGVIFDRPAVAAAALALNCVAVLVCM